MSLIRSQALPMEIILKLLKGYVFTLNDKLTKEFFIYKTTLVEGTIADGRVDIKARCKATDKKFMLLGTIETKTLLFIYYRLINGGLDKHAEILEKFWYGMIYGFVPQHIEIWHPHICQRCNRRLTDPRSIERGFGPTCGKLAKGV